MKAECYKIQPRRVSVTKRARVDRRERESLPAPAELSAATNCFVTPPPLAARAAALLEAGPDMLTLEPSAGTGALALALLEAGHSQFELTTVEKDPELRKVLRQRLPDSVPIMARDFLEYAAEVRGKVEFPRILMNPPFARGADIKHVRAALDLLHPGGHPDARLVAIVANGPRQRAAFEPLADYWEDLPAGTFPAAPGIRTALIRIAA